MAVPRIKLINLVLIISLAAFFLLAGFIYLYNYNINKKSDLAADLDFDIKNGQAVSEIARELKLLNAVDSEFLFRVYLKLNNLDKNIQAGKYRIPKSSSISELARILQFGRSDVKIRYREGARVEEFGLYITNELKKVDYREFVENARKYEGLLFPDTYIVNTDTDTQALLKLLRNTFTAKTSDLITPDKLSRVNLTENEAFVFASIIEREAAKEEDKRLIAGILIKRYREGMKLEADATTQYAVALTKHCVPLKCQDDEIVCEEDPVVEKCLSGLYPELLEGIKWWPHNITLYDLNFTSSYNTRKSEGLPPSPISSFSLSSLDAVMNFEDSPYYFYLTDDTGTTHYADTLDKHNYNINTYLYK